MPSLSYLIDRRKGPLVKPTLTLISMGALAQRIVALTTEIVPFLHKLPPLPPCLRPNMQNDLYPPFPLECIRPDNAAHSC